MEDFPKFHWKNNYHLDLDGDGEKEDHMVKLYLYTSRSLALVSTPEFGRAFSDNLKDIGARYNPHLKFNEEKKPGWIISLEKQLHLTDLLEKIHNHDVKPKIIRREFKKFDSPDHKTALLMKELVDTCPAEFGTHKVSDVGDIITTMIYGPSERVDAEVKTQRHGVVVYQFKTADKTAVFCQKHNHNSESDSDGNDSDDDLE